MPNPRSRSASVTAAATLLVLYSAAALFLWGYLFMPVLNAPPDEHGRHIYELHLISFLLVALVPPALVAGGVRTAVGLFQLKPWARIAVLVGAAVALLFCLAIISMWPFETFVIPSHFVSPLQSFRQRLGVTFVVVWLPISIWWLFLFRTKSVKAQFIGTNEEPSGAELPTAQQV